MIKILCLRILAQKIKCSIAIYLLGILKLHNPLINSEIPLSDVRKNIINTGEKYIDAVLNEQF